MENAKKNYEELLKVRAQIAELEKWEMKLCMMIAAEISPYHIGDVVVSKGVHMPNRECEITEVYFGFSRISNEPELTARADVFKKDGSKSMMRMFRTHWKSKDDKLLQEPVDKLKTM